MSRPTMLILEGSNSGAHWILLRAPFPLTGKGRDRVLGDRSNKSPLPLSSPSRGRNQHAVDWPSSDLQQVQQHEPFERR